MFSRAGDRLLTCSPALVTPCVFSRALHPVLLLDLAWHLVLATRYIFSRAHHPSYIRRRQLHLFLLSVLTVTYHLPDSSMTSITCIVLRQTSVCLAQRSRPSSSVVPNLRRVHPGLTGNLWTEATQANGWLGRKGYQWRHEGNGRRWGKPEILELRCFSTVA